MRVFYFCRYFSSHSEGNNSIFLRQIFFPSDLRVFHTTVCCREKKNPKCYKYAKIIFFVSMLFLKASHFFFMFSQAKKKYIYFFKYCSVRSKKLHRLKVRIFFMKFLKFQCNNIEVVKKPLVPALWC
jgi:hypothetical protein